MQAAWRFLDGDKRTRVGLGTLTIVAATLAAYVPALSAGFVWDDDRLLTANPLIRASDGLWRIWFTGQGVDYWPLTSTSLWFEWRLWGMNAWGYHATNVVLQIGCALLVWAILRQLRVPGAFLGALLFAVHPVGVESVAWITQRKTLLASAFFLGSLYCFVRHPRWYWSSVVCFTLAMLAKTSTVTLPLVLAGYLAWRGRAGRREWWSLVPFAVIAGVLGWVAWVFQSRSMGGVVPPADALQRILRAAAEFWFYLGKAVMPARLSFVYPQWRVDASRWIWWVPLVATLLVTVWLVERFAPMRFRVAHLRRLSASGRCAPPAGGLLYAWGYFCAALLPAAGLADFYFMRYSPVADHYEHLALVGVVALAAVGLRRAPWAAGAIVVALGVLTWQRCHVFANADTLYRDTLAKNPNAWMAHNNLAMILADQGEAKPALAHFQEAVRLKPDWADAHFNLGVEWEKVGESAKAIAEYEEAVRLQFCFPKARLALGELLTKAGRVPEGFVQDQLAFASSETAQDHCQLGDACAQEGRKDAALAEYRRALALDPHCGPALAAIQRYHIN